MNQLPQGGEIQNFRLNIPYEIGSNALFYALFLQKKTNSWDIELNSPYIVAVALSLRLTFQIFQISKNSSNFKNTQQVL